VEWSYGFVEEDTTGVYQVPPRAHSEHTYRVTVNMGPTQLRAWEVEAALQSLMDRWRGPDHNQAHHSCLDFCNAFCKVLGVGRIPGWVDRCGRTTCHGDNLSRRTPCIRSTKHLAKTVSEVSQNFSHEVEQAVSDARREVPRLVEDGVAGAQALSVGLMHWGQGLLGAAARALGDVDPAVRHSGHSRGGKSGWELHGGDALRRSLRNRGGVRTESKRSVAEVTRVRIASPTEEALDALLLGVLPASHASRIQDSQSQLRPQSTTVDPATEVLSATEIGASWVTLPQVRPAEYTNDDSDLSDSEEAFAEASCSSASSSRLERLQDCADCDTADVAASWVALPQLPTPPRGPHDSDGTRLVSADAPLLVADATAVSKDSELHKPPNLYGPLATTAAPGCAVERPKAAEAAEATSASVLSSSDRDGEDEWTML
jgi:hypothetical protein